MNSKKTEKKPAKVLGIKAVCDRLRELSGRNPILSIRDALGSESGLCIVGGTVRDSFYGTESQDIDLATILRPEEVSSKLQSSSVRVVETGLKHGTITAVIDENNIEITTFRKPSAHYANEYSQTIEEDLSGRDFSVNAIAYSIFKNEIVDPFNGVKDLEENTLRAVGNASERFSEDFLRILRMVRFGHASGRTVAEDLEKSARDLKDGLLKISAERIRTELEHILMSPFAGQGMRALRDLELLDYTVPELKDSVGFEQNEFHTEDVFEHTVSVIENCPFNLRLRLAALFHDIGKPATFSVDEKGRRHFYEHEIVGYKVAQDVMKRLKFSNDQIHSVSEIVRLHMRPLDCGPSGLRRLIRDLGEYFEEWKIFKRADSPPIMTDAEFKERMDNFNRMETAERARIAKTNLNKLAINGDDLKSMGVKPGVGMGKILKELENMTIENPELNTKEALIEKAKLLI